MFSIDQWLRIQSARCHGLAWWGLEIGDRVDGFGGEAFRFVEPAPAEPETTDASLIATAQEIWTAVLRQRYDTGQPEILTMVAIRAHQFEIGAAAADHSTIR
ncbi:hypothetical protein [Dactylosporangium sp. NPDC006015]|uniref:hypothetical protein n=1 Tax=Dactylosporangium sp. NPDC006015 TaxID=3154576 RepID=UPI0033B60C94